MNTQQARQKLRVVHRARFILDRRAAVMLAFGGLIGVGARSRQADNRS